MNNEQLMVWIPLANQCSTIAMLLKVGDMEGVPDFMTALNNQLVVNNITVGYDHELEIVNSTKITDSDVAIRGRYRDQSLPHLKPIRFELNTPTGVAGVCCELHNNSPDVFIPKNLHVNAKLLSEFIYNPIHTALKNLVNTSQEYKDAAAELQRIHALVIIDKPTRVVS